MVRKTLNLEGKVDLILKTVVSIDERVTDIEKTMATKSHVEEAADRLREELTKEMRAVGKAVDKDAVTIINHEKKLLELKNR